MRFAYTSESIEIMVIGKSFESNRITCYQTVTNELQTCNVIVAEAWVVARNYAIRVPDFGAAFSLSRMASISVAVSSSVIRTFSSPARTAPMFGNALFDPPLTPTRLGTFFSQRHRKE